MATACVSVKTVSATGLRDGLKSCLKAAKGNKVVLIENRRQSSKYLVDQEFLDTVIKERETFIGTIEILANRELANRLLTLSATIDDDVAAGRLLTMADVFSE